MMSLKTKDTKLEREAQAALETAKQNAEQIQQKRLERQKMMEDHEKRQMEFKQQLRATKRQAEKLKETEQKNLEQMEAKRKEVEEAKAQKAKIEQQLIGAKEALLKLESLLEKKKGGKKEELKKDILQLKDFIEANLGDSEKKDEELEVMSLEPENDQESIV